MPGPFDPTYGAPQNNFGGGPIPQQPQSFAPEIQGTPGGMDMFMDDPQFQIEFQKAIDSVPGLAEQMQNDPELQSHIVNTIAQGPGALHGAQGGAILPAQAQAPQGAPSTNPLLGGAPPQAAPDEQPEQFNNVGDYLKSQTGRDDAMMGLIMSNYGRDPEKALQMALQFKQIKDQRRYQAEQNKLQREATAANVKMKTDADKAEKLDKAWQQDAAKGEASLRTSGISPDEIISKIGPWTKDNSEQWKTEVTNAVARKKTEVAQEKEDQTDLKNKEGIANNVFTRGSVIPNKYTEPKLKDGKPNPKYDEAFAKGLEDLAKTRTDIQGIHNANLKAHSKLMERRYRLESGKMSDEQKVQVKLKFDELGDIHKRVMEAKKQIDMYTPYSEGNTPFGKAYQTFVADYNEAMEEYKSKASEIKGVTTADMAAIPTPGADEVATPPVTPAAPQPAPPPQQDAAMAQRIRGLQKLVNEAQQAGKDPKEIIERFKAKFPGVLAE